MEHFGKMPDGNPVDRITIQGGGLTAHLLTYGCVLQDLRLEGHDTPLVLGFEEFAPYLTQSPYFGAIAGRCANRIADGHLELDGKTYQLDRNYLGKHCLHGGSASTGKKLWTLQSHDGDSATFKIRLPDGDMGFPGQLDIRVQFALLANGVLDIQMSATTDAPTLCNLAHHSYFNLDGSATISDHDLKVDAPHFLPVDDGLIPTGRQQNVAGTGFDFRDFAPVGQAHPVDHTFCLSNGRTSEPRPVAWLKSPVSGVLMECLTTEPGLQVFDAATIDIPTPGLQGAAMGPHCGLAIEPQIWPDANHNKDFEQAVLRPGETYRQHSQFKFSKE